MEWAPEHVFWDTGVDEILVVPRAGEAPAMRVFVSQAADLKQPVLIALNAADSATQMESYSDIHLVRCCTSCTRSGRGMRLSLEGSCHPGP